jgi:hypothetical protein
VQQVSGGRPATERRAQRIALSSVQAGEHGNLILGETEPNVYQTGSQYRDRLFGKRSYQFASGLFPFDRCMTGAARMSEL